MEASGKGFLRGMRAEEREVWIFNNGPTRKWKNIAPSDSITPRLGKRLGLEFIFRNATNFEFRCLSAQPTLF